MVAELAAACTKSAPHKTYSLNSNKAKRNILTKLLNLADAPPTFKAPELHFALRENINSDEHCLHSPRTHTPREIRANIFLQSRDVGAPRRLLGRPAAFVSDWLEVTVRRLVRFVKYGNGGAGHAAFEICGSIMRATDGSVLRELEVGLLWICNGMLSPKRSKR